MTRHVTAIRFRLVVLAAAFVLGVSPGLAAASPQPRSGGPDAWENHCETPFGGYRGGELVDLNELFGRSEAFVHPRYCPQVDAGERWIVGRGCIASWVTNREHARYPSGYVPSGATPMEDFLSKVTVKVVVDPGSDHERAHFYRYGDDPSIATVIPAGPNPFGPDDLPVASLIPRNAPLPVGTHVVDVYVVMSADHWDGLGSDPQANRLAAGATRLTANNRFEVVPRSGGARHGG